MPMFIEYDRITGEIRRVLSADVLPPDIAHLSCLEVPPGTPGLDLTGGIEAARKIVASQGHATITAPSPGSPVTKPPLLEKV